jgi:hypothetical protein
LCWKRRSNDEQKGKNGTEQAMGWTGRLGIWFGHDVSI